MESPSAQENCHKVAQEDSNSLDQRQLATTSLDAASLEVIVPKVDNDNFEERKNRVSQVEDPDNLEVALINENQDNSPMPPKEIAIPLDSLEPIGDPKVETSLASGRLDAELSSFVGNKDPEEIESESYDENLFVDEGLGRGFSESVPMRKRQAIDFLPINAEIKRIGVEISEEHAKQLKNDVRRLSPVLVSLRERTLGEISLTSDSGLFEDNETSPSLVCRNTSTKGSPENPKSSSLINETTEETDTRLPMIVSRTESEESSIVTANEGTSEDFISLEVFGAINELVNVGRELVIVLSRIDRESSTNGARNEVTEKTEDHETSDNNSSGTVVDNETIVDESSTIKEVVEKTIDNIVEKCCRAETDNFHDKIIKDDETRDQINDNGDEKNKRTISSDRLIYVGDVCLSPKYHDNDQLRRKSPMVVIKRTLDDVTFVAKRSSERKIKNDDDNNRRINLDCVRRSLAADLNESRMTNDDDEVGSREENNSLMSDRSADVQESLPDTETETETGSDNSEIISIASVHSGDCAETISDPSNCPESDSIVSDDTTGSHEPERPEAFTDDSAESLALAIGARDEVRSDGSDSGLGSEIRGDPRPAPAPESDSETSFLDRIPDDILSDKDKAANPLEAFVPNPETSGIQSQQQETHHQQQQLSLPSFPTPPKSSLKRRLTDCMEGEPSPKRINTDDPMRKKRNIQFDAVTVYYFPRAQGFTCVPSQGGSTLGMSATHTHAERFSLTEHAAEQRRLHRARLAQLRSERAANCVTEAASSSEDPSDDTDEEPSDTEELDIDSYYFLQPVPTWQRRALLRAAGVRRIDAIEKDDCRDIRASREHCGCGCKGYCDPESCPCSRANVKCQVDRAGFPCGCSRDGCANSSGRIEFNPVRVRTHFIHTLMRLQLEKKQRDEDRTDHDLLMNNQIGRSTMREVPGMMGAQLGPMDHPNVITGDPVSCINAGGFTTLHYETHEQNSGSCTSGIVHAAREDSLDLYAIRDDCYPSEEVDGGPNSQRKLHPEFGQAFQAFPGQQPAVSFPQGAYQDYQGYQALASTSRSQFQPQFQNVTSANPAFGHYPYGPQDPNVMQTSSCQSHSPLPSHHSSVYETGFSQEDPNGDQQQQYTNLNSVQPMNAVVQQMGKLEPFSELLAGRYSYYGDPEPQPIAVGYHNNDSGNKIENDKSQNVGQQPVETGTDDCDENFGEIIKKSMVETVSA